MTVQDLLDLLADKNPKAEVRLATQPHYPLAYEVEGVTAVQARRDDEVVYIVEGAQLGYAPRKAFDDVECP